ncbi:MAG TPA: hypothetical protein QF753_18585 [Victivallales bacterium]|nr:hypothetical protein [Victivallales bacterium]
MRTAILVILIVVLLGVLIVKNKSYDVKQSKDLDIIALSKMSRTAQEVKSFANKCKNISKLNVDTTMMSGYFNDRSSFDISYIINKTNNQKTDIYKINKELLNFIKSKDCQVYGVDITVSNTNGKTIDQILIYDINKTNITAADSPAQLHEIAVNSEANINYIKSMHINPLDSKYAKNDLNKLLKKNKFISNIDVSTSVSLLAGYNSLDLTYTVNSISENVKSIIFNTDKLILEHMRKYDYPYHGVTITAINKQNRTLSSIKIRKYKNKNYSNLKNLKSLELLG